jgi:Ca-activated chloride channel family protein
MAEEFLLDCRVDQPAVLAGQGSDVYVLTTINPNPARLGSLHEVGPEQSLPAHLIVLVDVSGSMQEIIRDDPHARVIGHDTSEGQPVSIVQTSVPSRLAVAQGVVKRLIDRMKPTDRLTLVAFDHQAYPLLAATSAADKLAMYRAAGGLSEAGGGGTSLGRGFQAVLKSLSGLKEDGTRRLVLLTDGKDQEPDLALEQAHAIAMQNHIPIHAFGTGECRADFLKQVAQASGAFDYIFREEEAEQCFDRVFRSQQNILATKVTLSLWLSPEIYVQELYRTRPEILYVGAMKPDANNVLTVPIEYLERGKDYQFLFQCKLPGRKALGGFRLARATLTYDVPSLGLTDQKTEANIVVEYTDDRSRAQVRVGDVRRVIAQAEVQRQVLFLQEKIDAIEKGAASTEDRAIVARLLDTLIKKYTEFNDQAQVNQYRTMLAEYQRKGTISQDMLNRSLASSSRPQGSGTVVVDPGDY